MGASKAIIATIVLRQRALLAEGFYFANPIKRILVAIECMAPFRLATAHLTCY
jgi:hypothetical protein